MSIACACMRVLILFFLPMDKLCLHGLHVTCGEHALHCAVVYLLRMNDAKKESVSLISMLSLITTWCLTLDALITGSEEVSETLEMMMALDVSLQRFFCGKDCTAPFIVGISELANPLLSFLEDRLLQS